MTTTTKKLIFFTIWVGILSIGIYTIFVNTPIGLVLKSKTATANLFQRFDGIFVYLMLFVQIILGAYMNFWKEKLGDWILKFHIFEGVLIYIFVLGHTLAFLLFNYFSSHKLDPFAVYVDVCLLCGNINEYLYSIGRINFWLITLTVFVGLFRASTPFLRANWRKFHILNYVVFILIAIHSIALGTDVGTVPFKYLHGPSIVIVSGIIIYKLILFFRSSSLTKT